MKRTFPFRRRATIQALALLLVAAYWQESAAAQTSPAEPSRVPPNVVLILADDLGIGDLRSYNADSKIPTPNLDALAAEGVRFTDAHAPGAWCTPSRYGLLTGRYPSRAADMNWQQRALIEPGQSTLASLLRESGYSTAMIGKWHLGFDGGADCARPLRGGPVDRGFDHFFGIHASTDIPPYFYIRDDQCVAAPTRTIAAGTSEGDVWTNIQGAFWRAGAISPGLRLEGVLPRFEEEAVSFLERHHRNASGRPFFLYLALTGPHTPWLPLPRFHEASGAGMYGDFTVQVDDVVGQVTTALQRLGYAENTLVIFTSDNGPVWYPKDVQRFGHRSSHVYRGMKFDLWEGGHRMPFIARWPGRIPAASVSDAPVSFTDLLATLAAASGRELPAPSTLDSENILPAMLGRPTDRPPRETIVHFAGQGDLAIRQGPWKLIPRRAGGELYNLADDASETRNLYAAEPEVVRRLEAALEGHRRTATGNGGTSPSP